MATCPERNLDLPLHAAEKARQRGEPPQAPAALVGAHLRFGANSSHGPDQAAVMVRCRHGPALRRSRSGPSLAGRSPGAPVAASILGSLLLALPCAAGQVRAVDGSAGAPPPPRDVELTSGGVRLAGSLRLPGWPAAPPRRRAGPGLAPHRPRRRPHGGRGQAFVDAGFAALTTDSRGVGGSQGDFDLASIDLLADDAASAIAFLRRRPEVRANAVGLGAGAGRHLGRTPRRGTSRRRLPRRGLRRLDSPEAHTHRFLAAHLRARGLDDEAVARAEAVRAQVRSYYATGAGYQEALAAVAAARDEPWFDAAGLPAPPAHRASSPPSPPARGPSWRGRASTPGLHRRLPCPLLAVYGGEDSMLPVARDAEALRALASRHAAEITVVVAPGLDHDLRRSTDATEGPGTDPEVLIRMVAWAAEQVGSSVPDARPVGLSGRTSEMTKAN